MRSAGDASYSIYLSHYLFLAVVIASVDSFDLSVFARALMAPFTIAAAVFVGFLTYQLMSGHWAGIGLPTPGFWDTVAVCECGKSQDCVPSLTMPP